MPPEMPSIKAEFSPRISSTMLTNQGSGSGGPPPVWGCLRLCNIFLASDANRCHCNARKTNKVKYIIRQPLSDLS